MNAALILGLLAMLGIYLNFFVPAGTDVVRQVLGPPGGFLDAPRMLLDSVIRLIFGLASSLWWLWLVGAGIAMSMGPRRGP